MLLKRSQASAMTNVLSKGKAKHQSGVALISVMLIVALCVIIAAQLVTDQRLHIERSQNLFDRKQAFQYAKSSERFVQSLLTETFKDSQGKASAEQDWAKSGMSFPVDSGMIEGQIIDLATCLNLNALATPDMSEAQRIAKRDVFVRLLEALEIEAEISHEDLANNVYDWIDKDDYPVDAIGYDGDMYASMDFPYLSANSHIAHENELRVIHGFDPLVMNELKGHVCAVPASHDLAININTLDSEKPEYLMAVLDIDKATAQDLISERPEEGYDDIDDFWNSAKAKALKNITPDTKSYFTVSSKFFKLITNASYNDANFALTSLIQLDTKYQASIIGRRFGGEVERKANPEDEQPKD
jgi:general secretion pathway protein K